MAGRLTWIGLTILFLGAVAALFALQWHRANDPGGSGYAWAFAARV